MRETIKLNFNTLDKVSIWLSFVRRGQIVGTFGDGRHLRCRIFFPPSAGLLGCRVWPVRKVAPQKKGIDPSHPAVCYLTDLITGHFLHSNHLAADMCLEESCGLAERSIMDNKCPSGPGPSLFSLYLYLSFFMSCARLGEVHGS